MKDKVFKKGDLVWRAMWKSKVIGFRNEGTRPIYICADRMLFLYIDKYEEYSDRISIRKRRENRLIWRLLVGLGLVEKDFPQERQENESHY